MGLSVQTSATLLEHLSLYVVDGTTVKDTLFDGGRLAYPGRKDIEHQLGYVEPYSLELEARIIDGLPTKAVAAIKYLAAVATNAHRGSELTLDLLWGSHMEYSLRGEGPSLDRLVAALVCIEDHKAVRMITDDGPLEVGAGVIFKAAEIMISTFHSVGIPLTVNNLEELFDGADPACVGLGLIEL